MMSIPGILFSGRGGSIGSSLIEVLLLVSYCLFPFSTTQINIEPGDLV